MRASGNEALIAQGATSRLQVGSLQSMSAFALRPFALRLSSPAKAEAAPLSRDDLRRVLIAVGVALLFCVTLVLALWAVPIPQQSGPSAAPRVAKPAWIEIAKPLRLFALTAPEWGREPTTYTAQRHRDGGGRRDNLTFGTFGADQPWLHLTLYRMGSEEATAAPFFVDMARRAAPAGLAVAHMSKPTALSTRFGAFQVADFTLEAPAGTSGQSTQCLGFRLDNAKVLQIGGFACGTPGKPIERARLACTLDRIDLVAAGDDTEMRAFFTSVPGEAGAACRDRGPSLVRNNVADTQQADANESMAPGFRIVR
jgi:hypothetical protein